MLLTVGSIAVWIVECDPLEYREAYHMELLVDVYIVEVGTHNALYLYGLYFLYLDEKMDENVPFSSYQHHRY